MRKRHVNEFLKTSFRNSGRIAGHGMAYDACDRYGDEDFPDYDYNSGRVRVKLPSDELSTKEKEALSGPVITYTLNFLSAKKPHTP